MSNKQTPPMTSEEIIALESKHACGVYAQRDVAIVRGQGSRVWDADGKEYIDCMGGIAVASIGHCHPKLTAAVVEQLNTIIVVPCAVHNDKRARFQARLAEVTPAGLDSFFLCNSGAEAVEGAIKFARLVTGKPGVIATMRGFHGRTLGALSATWKSKYRQPFTPLVPGFTHVKYDDLDAMAGAIDDTTAAIIIEPVQGEGGVRPASAAYMRGLRELCDERGVMLIADEIQTGFGRTGKWFGCDHYDVVPDIMALGKAIAGGVPMGAIAMGPRVGKIPASVHGSTFGGNPLACAAGLAALDIYENEGLVARSAEMGTYFREQLAALDTPLIREVRGVGLMLGVELKIRVGPVIKALMDNGLIGLPAGPTVLRLLPPLVISKEDIDTAVEIIRTTLDEFDS